MLEPLQAPIFQRGLIEVLILAIPAGLLGTWIVLRSLAFFSHAVGTAAYPGLVLAAGLGFSPALGALGAALAFGATTEAMASPRRQAADAVTALALAGFLAAGVILASDVFRSGAATDNLLFGSIFLVTPVEIAIAGAVATGAVALASSLGSRWLAAGFDPSMAKMITAGTGWSRWERPALLLAIATTAATMLPILGALLAGALLVLPAASARLITSRMGSWKAASVAIAAVEGSVGLWIAALTDLPPGPVIASLAAATFALLALAITMQRAVAHRLGRP